MIEITHILCPIDFSEFSQRAFNCAVTMARWYESRVTALHVAATWPTMDVVAAPGTYAAPPIALSDVHRDALMRQVQGVVDCHSVPDVHVDVKVQEAADVHREILDQAGILKADLIVMGSHGRSGFERLLLGSVTEKVLRKATCPIMVVPRRVGEAALASAAHFHRILCPVDFSGTSLAALAFAMSLAEEADAHLILIHAIEVPPELAASPTSADFNVDVVRAAAEAECLRRLRALVPDSVREVCTVSTVAAEGRASREILRLAADQQADLIVMGVQGRGAVDLMVFGSNTQNVIREAACPVLTVRGR